MLINGSIPSFGGYLQKSANMIDILFDLRILVAVILGSVPIFTYLVSRKEEVVPPLPPKDRFVPISKAKSEINIGGLHLLSLSVEHAPFLQDMPEIDLSRVVSAHIYAYILCNLFANKRIWLFSLVFDSKSK